MLLGRCGGDGRGEYGLCQYRGGGDLVIDRVHTWKCWLWLCGAGTQAVCTVKVTVPLAMSCRRMGGVDGQLEQSVGFAGLLLGIELSCFVE